MNAKLSTALLLVAMAATSPACAGSVAQPGSTLGLPTGAPRPEGVYVEDTSSYGERSTAPNGLGVNLTQVVWSTPFAVADTRLSLFFMQPTVYRTKVDDGAFYTNSTLFAARLAHAFGNGFNASYQAGFRAAQPSPFAYQQSSLDQRAALTYAADGYNLTANLLNGVFFAAPPAAQYPNWLNLDLTATKKLGKLEVGPVAYLSTDLSTPATRPTYRREGQVALGGFAGYDFGRFILQGFVTRDVAVRGYSGVDTRGWTRVIVPLFKPAAEAAPAGTPF